jgi:hypothetical protein
MRWAGQVAYWLKKFVQAFDGYTSIKMVLKERYVREREWIQKDSRSSSNGFHKALCCHYLEGTELNHDILQLGPRIFKL